jgi:ribosomal protein S18 acetylase RimI-like enzyme
MPSAPIAVTRATSPEDVTAARTLFVEYGKSLGFDLGFQDFESELRDLPGDYAPPGGMLLLAREAGVVIGCVALRPIDGSICEMKRLYVAPSGRGKGVGRALVREIVTAARSLGYRRIRLDTVPSMTAARALYRSFGFRDIDPYRFNPIPGTSFMELDLDDESGRGERPR